MYPTNEIPKVQEIREPYSVTRENNGKKAISRSYGSDGIVRYYYEDDSAIIFNVFDKTMYIVDCNNEIISTSKPTQKYDLDLFHDAVDIFKGNFARQ